MAMSFFKDYEKLNIGQDQSKNGTKDVTSNISASVEDMKAYFDAMRESIINEVTEQINNIKKEGIENASNTDLPDSKPDSAESPVDRSGSN